jgi:hypothetical protein
VAIDFFLFVFDAEPGEEIFPGGGEAADFGFEGVGEDAEGVGVEELGDVAFVICQVVVEGVLEFDVGVFEFDEDEGESVDVQQDVGAAVGAIALYPELGDGEVFVLIEGVVVNNADATGFGSALGVFVFDGDAVSDQSVDGAVGGDRGEGGVLVGEDGECLVDGDGGQVWVEAVGGGFEAIAEDHIAFVGAVGAIVEVVGVGGVAVEELETVLLEFEQDRLFDVVFGDKVWHGMGRSRLHDRGGFVYFPLKVRIMTV